MKIEEIPIREIRWSGRSRFLRHSPYGEEDVYKRQTARSGDTVKFALDMEKVHLFDKETEITITN